MFNIIIYVGARFSWWTIPYTQSITSTEEISIFPVDLLHMVGVIILMICMSSWLDL